MIVITGQTATGKTKLAIDYAQKYRGDLINFDSRQIYQYLNIITGKDLQKNTPFYLWQEKKINQKLCRIGYYFLKKNKIWLYDIVPPNQQFSSFDFVQVAQLVITKIKKEKKTPILVGGSYFYLKHLLYGFDYQVPPNLRLRKELGKLSIKELQKKLKEIAPQKFNELNQSDKNNPHRLIRKIEIFSNFCNQEKKLNKKNLYQPTFFIGLKFKNKDDLKKAIVKRVEKRLKNGAIDEVKKLIKLGFKKTDPGLKTIGYQQLLLFLEGKINKKQAIDQWIKAEIQYAKRQETFMKKDKNIIWREPYY